MARGRGLGGYQLKELATPSEATLFRMLQCIPGVSEAKAAAVIEHYHSVAELVEAYESLPSEAEKEKLLVVGVKWEVERRINWGAVHANGFFHNESTRVFAVFQISWISNKTNVVFVLKNRRRQTIQSTHHTRQFFGGSIHVLHFNPSFFRLHFPR